MKPRQHADGPRGKNEEASHDGETLSAWLDPRISSRTRHQCMKDWEGKALGAEKEEQLPGSAKPGLAARMLTGPL